MSEFFLPFVLALIAGVLGSTLHKWSLARRLYSLECDVADLQDKVLVEIKRRAGITAKLSRDEQKILDALNEAPKAPQQPWWLPYTNPENRKAQ